MLNNRVWPSLQRRDLNSPPPCFRQVQCTPLGDQTSRGSPRQPTKNGAVPKKADESRHQSSMAPLFARSRAEQVLFDATNSGEKMTSNKYRQLPCRTFLATGHCPYKDRCVYLHCPSIRSAFIVSIFPFPLRVACLPILHIAYCVLQACLAYHIANEYYPLRITHCLV